MFPSSLILGVFMSLLIDNLLLTVVVPILPEFLREQASLPQAEDVIVDDTKLTITTTLTPVIDVTIRPSSVSPQSQHYQGYLTRVKTITESCLRELFHLQMLDEDSKLGVLFSTKAIVQLMCNPFIGRLTIRFGYKIPLTLGNLILCLCALGFGFADSYFLLLIGRSFHGVASALIAISGMALIAELYPIDAERTVAMGRAMGASAIGVLIGYPFGGLVYAFFGKLCPFLLIALLALINGGLYASKIQIYNGEFSLVSLLSQSRCGSPLEDDKVMQQMSSLWSLLKDRSILLISLAVWFSTMAIAVLESTLPVWLIETVDPPKWELGLVFVPDSLGYFIGTNFFGQVAIRFGRWRVSMISMCAIGTGCLLLPFCRSVWQLGIPHLILGLGLGIVDAGLMPLLALFAEDREERNYGSVYALAQTGVALAYSLGPLLGGQLVRIIGFPDLIRCIGFLNLIFSPFLLLLMDREENLGHGIDHLNSDYNPNYFDLTKITPNNAGLLSSSVTSSGSNSPTTKSRSWFPAGTTKRVRFHFRIPTEAFPLKGITKSIDSKMIDPNSGTTRKFDPYERFYDDLESD